MAKPFRASFVFYDKVFSEISLNRTSGEFYYFPKLKERLVDGTKIEFEASYDDMELYPEVPDHFSWHKDGTLHVKYQGIDKKTIISVIEKPLHEIGRKDILPILNFSTRSDGRELSIACLIIGNDLIHRLDLLPKPYSFFIIKGRNHPHISILTDSGSNLNFSYLFMTLPVFIPKDNMEGHFSFTAPLQEGDLEAVYNDALLARLMSGDVRLSYELS